MGLFTSSETSYTLFSALLMRSCPELVLPEQPLVAISLRFSLLLAEGKYPVPWKKFSTIIEAMEEEIRNNASSELRKLEHQQVFSDMPGTIRSVGMHEGFPSIDLQHESIQALYTIDPADKNFEMSDWPKPPKQLKDHFDSPLDDSPLFEMMDDSNSKDLFNTLTNDSYTEVIEEDGLASFITSLIDDKFPEEISRSLMNAFI